MGASTSSWIGTPDPERRELINRALNVSGAGSVLLQTFINRVVQQLTLRELGLQAVLDRKPGSGNAAYINRRSAGTTGGAWVADTDTATEETGSFAQASFTYRTLLTKGKVTRALQSRGKTYGDVLAQELAGKAEDFADLLEDGLITGNTAASSNQINGLLTLVNAQASTQVIANTTASAGDDLVLAKLDEAIDAVKGGDNPADLVIVGSKAGVRKLNNELQAQQVFNDVTEIAAGFRVRTYDGSPIIRSTRMPDTLVGATNQTQINTFTGGTTTALAIVNRRYVWIEELEPQTVVPLAKDTSQYDQFEIYWDGALVFANTRGAALLIGIKAA